MVRPPSRHGVVSVVLPVYGGRDVTRACLSALARQTGRHRLDVVVVDDASPDGDLASDAAAIAASEGWRHIRNERNLGFAASVNRGACLSEGSHILLLNADAILPADAVDRLLVTASGPNIGTVVPLSNDGGFGSFPITRRVNPPPSAAEAGRVDAAARQAATHHGLAGRAVDIPAGTAFCMLVTGPCWDALGGLDLGYGRGYFEDVDLCLRARRIGFRNVLAPDVYVRHFGGQSFKALKKALVAENARVLLERFPDYDADWMAFAESDPLAAVRRAIECRLPSLEPVHVVAGRGASMLAGAAASAGGARPAPRRLVLQEGRCGELRLKAADDGVPQSLHFRRHQRADWASYMRSLPIESLSLMDPSEELVRDLEAVVRDTASVSLTVMGPRSLRLVLRRPGLLARARVDAPDRMSRAALGQHTDPLPPPREPEAGPPRLAALVPWPTVAVDRLVVALDRRLRASGGEVVVFGQSIGARDRPTASGAMGPEDYPDAIRHRGITHLLLPDVDAPFRFIEDLRRVHVLPSAYVDWSSGRHRAAPGDLALSMASGGDERVAAIAAWCLARVPCGRLRP